MDIFTNLSPLDHRYRQSNPSLYQALSAILSERAVIAYQLRAEGALLKAHLQQRQQLTAEKLALIDQALARVSAEEVYQEEDKTRHNIRALVNVLVAKLPPELAPLVHLGATSMDIVDTVTAMRVRDVVLKVILPQLLKLEDALLKICRSEAARPQIGRTHGQYAVPITVGHTLAEYVSRLGQSLLQIEQLTHKLCGKLSGAVGAYNATSLISPDPKALEKSYLDFLGLRAGEYSSQIVMPEAQLRLLQEINLAFGVVANLADDLRHLQRSEIDEVREFFAAEQVGSSTMPQKRNPWNCEHVKSLWKAFAPRIMTFYLDQISEHQRDLSNSASGRFVSDYLAGFSMAVERMHDIVAHMSVNYEQLERNLQNAGDLIMAEPLYILLAMSGLNDAHEVVRRLTLKRQQTGIPLGELVLDDQELHQRLKRQLQTVGCDAELLQNPSLYLGLSAQQALQIADRYQEELKLLAQRLRAEEG